MARFLRGPCPVGVTAASWCGRCPGSRLRRPPAVAVIGLRRSGRTGNGESPRGRIAPARQAGSLYPRPIPVPGSATRAAAPPGARRAPRALEDVEIVITKSGNIRCRRRAHGRFRWPGGESDSVAGL